MISHCLSFSITVKNRGMLKVLRFYLSKNRWESGSPELWVGRSPPPSEDFCREKAKAKQGDYGLARAGARPARLGVRGACAAPEGPRGWGLCTWSAWPSSHPRLLALGRDLVAVPPEASTRSHERGLLRPRTGSRERLLWQERGQVGEKPSDAPLVFNGL